MTRGWKLFDPSQFDLIREWRQPSRFGHNRLFYTFRAGIIVATRRQQPSVRTRAHASPSDTVDASIRQLGRYRSLRGLKHLPAAKTGESVTATSAARP